MTEPNKEHLFPSGSSPSGTIAEREPPDVLAGTLADRMSEEPPDPTGALPMLADIAECVAALDASGKQHTELSPATILLTKEGKISIRSYAFGQTQGTIAFGNPKYVSPDAFRKGPDYQDSTLRGIYILGFIFYEFLSGKALFREQFSTIDDPPGWIIWHTSDTTQVKPLTELMPGFPAAIAQIVDGMLEKDPAKRTKDLTKIAARLRSASERTVVNYERPNNNPSFTNGTNTPAPAVVTETPRLGQEIIAKITQFARKTYAVVWHWLISQSHKRITVKSPAAARTGGRNSTGSPSKKITHISIARAGIFGGLAVGLAVLAVWLWRFGSDSSPSPASATPVAIETDSGEMVRVHGREIAVGTSAAGPNDPKKRTAYLESFYIDRYQVSNSSYRRFCLSTRRTCPDYLLGPEYAKHADDPVLDVSADDARAYAEWAGKWLPSVAEWRAAMLSEPGLIGLGPSRTATLAGGVALEWTDSDFRNSFGKADTGVRVLKADLRTNQLTLLPAPGSLKGSGIGFRCVSGAHILETSHFRRELKLPDLPHKTPSSAPLTDQETSAATAPQQPRSASPAADTNSEGSPDKQKLPPDGDNDQPDLRQNMAARVDLATSGHALTAAPERISFSVAANVRDAVVLVNGKSTNLSLVNGSRRLSLAPGKYHVTVRHDNYEVPPSQLIELKSEDARTQTLSFSLVPSSRNAVLSVASAPAEAEVLVDRNHVGNIGASGAFTADVSPGTHSVTLRKQNYEALSKSLEFSAGNTINLSGADMKPFGAIALKVSPANAHITLRRKADSQDVSLPNDTTYVTPPGDYVISAAFDKYTARRETVTIAPGEILSIGWDLKTAPDITAPIRTPHSLFEDSVAWRVDPSGWWVHDGKGYTFLRAKEGTFAWQIRRDAPKGGIFRSKSKKVTFVAEYKSDDDRIVYTLDPHFITKRVYSGKKLREERKSEIAEGPFSLWVQMTPQTVLLKSASGKVLDIITRTGEPGKFGFLDEVWLSTQ